VNHIAEACACRCAEPTGDAEFSTRHPGGIGALERAAEAWVDVHSRHVGDLRISWGTDLPSPRRKKRNVRENARKGVAGGLGAKVDSAGAAKVACEDSLLPRMTFLRGLRRGLPACARRDARPDSRLSAAARCDLLRRVRRGVLCGGRDETHGGRLRCRRIPAPMFVPLEAWCAACPAGGDEAGRRDAYVEPYLPALPPV